MTTWSLLEQTIMSSIFFFFHTSSNSKVLRTTEPPVEKLTFLSKGVVLSQKFLQAPVNLSFYHVLLSKLLSLSLCSS